MAAKKKKRKKKYCPGQFGPGGRRVKRGTCKRTRCKGQMAGSTKGGRPKRRKTTACLKPKRKKKIARKRPAAKRRVARKRSKGVMSHGHMVYGAAAKAVKKKRARKGGALSKRRAAPKRHRAVRGRAGATIGSISREQARIEHELAEINRDLKDLRSY